MDHSNADLVDAYVTTILSGELVAFPTETVYGLGGDATQADAIAKIYALKNRPSFNPLICHVADLEAAARLGVFSQAARRLAEKFWPGPLTLVVPRQPDCAVAPLASAGLESIALRVPEHARARDFLKAVGRPLVAPSANPSGTLSPTTAAHVAQYFPHLPIIDGGPCRVGIESSIVGCLDAQSYWLRAGGISRAEIEAILGQNLHEAETEKDTQARLAPGRLTRHYAPQHALQICEEPATDDDAVIVYGDQTDPAKRLYNLSPSGNDVEAASRLYALLHEIDAALPASGRILVRPFITAARRGGLHEALMDRLVRAAEQ